MSPLDGPSGGRSLYVELVAHGMGDAFDRYVVACTISVAAGDVERTLTEALGLSAETFGHLVDSYFPNGRSLLPSVSADATAGEDALEEPDLRLLLLEHCTRGTVDEEWLAAIITRRSLRPNHLWQDLGLFNGCDLSRLLRRTTTLLPRPIGVSR
jgi:nitrogen fixation protein NifQ